MEDEKIIKGLNKICGVCGDRALGYNFNAVSCESCKAFFRRNALKNKGFRCPFSENCVITPVTRRFCQKCRLDKCFGIGMRKEYIMSEEDKVLKRQRIEQNRVKKKLRTQNIDESKTNKDVIDNEIVDDTSMSVTSVTSNLSETYFLDTDTKYTEFGEDRQILIDNMSPATATSAPSPSIPLENIDVAETKTLNAIKETSHSVIDFTESQRQSSFRTNDPRIGRNLCSKSLILNQYESNESSHVSQNIEQKHLLEAHSTSDDYNISSSSKDYKQNTIVESNTWHENNSSLDYADQKLIETLAHQVCKDNSELKINNYIDYAQDSNFLMKIISQPNLVAKIFQDMSVILKILANPKMMKKLTTDPEVSKFVKENNLVSSDNESTKILDQFNNPIGDIPKNEKNSNNTCLTSKTINSVMKNPILTDLINDSKKQNNQSNESNKNNHGFKTDTMQDILQDVERIPITADSIESILSQAIKLEYSSYSALGGTQNSRELNDTEMAKLNELIVANKALLAPLDEDITNLIGDEYTYKADFNQSDPMLLDLINLTAIAIRRLIKMSKKISAFKNMCQEDQLALLKGGCTEMMILRSANTYDPDKDSWKIVHSRDKTSDIKVDVLKEAKGNLYAEHAKFLQSFDPRWKDENIILILSAIALFTPDRPKVVHSDVIKLEQNSYYYLLRRYLESVYPGCEAKSMFLKLIQKIAELHRLNEEVVEVYLNVNPSSIEPLLIEIFDLKH